MCCERQVSKKEVSSLKGCSSGVGFNDKTKEHKISLEDNCLSVGTIMHEVMHRLGFEHEHSRPDRARYIDVHKDNIRNSMLQFESNYGRAFASYLFI